MIYTTNKNGFIAPYDLKVLVGAYEDEESENCYHWKFFKRRIHVL